MDKVALTKVKAFEADYLMTLKSQNPKVLEGLKAGKLDAEQTDVLKATAKQVAERHN
jgi:F-type H+/Na+-transporting ATPase subunit alpha